MFVDKIDELFQNASKYELEWCKMLKIRNPYVDNFPVHFSKKLPLFDGPAYRQYTEYNYVYDKLCVSKSQNKK